MSINSLASITGLIVCDESSFSLYIVLVHPWLFFLFHLTDTVIRNAEAEFDTVHKMTPGARIEIVNGQKKKTKGQRHNSFDQTP